MVSDFDQYRCPALTDDGLCMLYESPTAGLSFDGHSHRDRCHRQRGLRSAEFRSYRTALRHASGGRIRIAQREAEITGRPKAQLSLKEKKCFRRMDFSALRTLDRPWTPAGQWLKPCANVRSLVAGAPVAQLDRASASGAEGHRFKSCQAHHNIEQDR